MEILRDYYGDDIELVADAPIQDIMASYPGTPLRLGAVGDNVAVVQVMLNRISRNYPAIPKISPVTGAFGESTQEAVREFQRIFGLTPDGVVGKATWYKLVYLYVGVQRLAELVSEGQIFYNVEVQFPGVLREGDSGNPVRILQYMLALLSEFDDALLPLDIDGTFGPRTTQAVRQYQSLVGLAPDGVVGEATWNSLYRHASQAYFALSRDTVLAIAQAGESVPTMMTEHNNQSFGEAARIGQHPGYDISLGQNDGQDHQEGVQV